ncbi:hypothetical protein BpHYR1_038154 [Brachionus plicatilis]|uniref:Uncharacterized protein n=1 Tax=Brachionus plicatilis TaxID=10195 RepID=A0A3M7RM87_BRAPC|nr:hypothetical protein BpHYR1_038154 [Brachionus plicatilis]
MSSFSHKESKSSNQMTLMYDSKMINLEKKKPKPLLEKIKNFLSSPLIFIHFDKYLVHYQKTFLVHASIQKT